jgi:hypothetical protein
MSEGRGGWNIGWLMGEQIMKERDDQNGSSKEGSSSKSREK